MRKKEKLFKFKIFRVCETDLVTIEACEDTPAMAMDLSIGGKRSKYLKAKKNIEVHGKPNHQHSMNIFIKLQKILK